MRRTTWAVAACVAVAVDTLSFAPAVQASDTQAVPHGCASVSSDWTVAVEPLERHIAVETNSNAPCTFRYAEGDTFAGTGRFTVSCSSGGYYHHPDFQGGQNPPVVGVPIPQPCDVGATVTLEGYHLFTGGMVVGGGLSAMPEAPTPRATEGDFRDLCAPGSEPTATVDLRMPVDYSGLLTYTGSVRCDDATIDITALTVTPLAGYPFPSAGTASCKKCKRPISVTGTVPAQAWIYEVELSFAVSAPGRETVTATRLGRYVVTWAGVVTTVCPGVRPWDDPAQPPLYVPAGETCPL
jgi:hypothetical protein